jgi:hypothetical protein
VLVAGFHGRADADCPVPADATDTLAAVPDADRLDYVRAALRDEVTPIRAWTGGWTAGYLLLTTAQVAAAPAVPADDRPDWWLGAAGSAVGLAAMLALPLGVIDDGLVFESYARALAPAHDPCALLARGERWLAEGAADEAFGAGWVLHVGNAALNLAVGLVIGLVWGHWLSAGINLGVGLAVGEAMILTQPTGLVDAWEGYRSAEAFAP